MRHEVSCIEADAVRSSVGPVEKLGADVESVDGERGKVRHVQRVVLLGHKHVLLGVNDDVASIRRRTDSLASFVVNLHQQHQQHYRKSLTQPNY